MPTGIGERLGLMMASLQRAYSSMVRAGDSSKGVAAQEWADENGMNSGKPQRRGDTDGGNPEPSRRYTAGRCRDYLGA